MIKHAKFSYSLIDSQLLPHAPDCGYNSMFLQSTYTPYLQHLSNWRWIWSPVEHQWWSFFVGIVDVFRPLAIVAEELSRGCLTEF